MVGYAVFSWNAKLSRMTQTTIRDKLDQAKGVGLNSPFPTALYIYTTIYGYTFNHSDNAIKIGTWSVGSARV